LYFEAGLGIKRLLSFRLEGRALTEMEMGVTIEGFSVK
jgi:hypothetical protein